jgi:hypothetical protein
MKSMATTDSHGTRLPVNNLIPFRPAKRHRRSAPQNCSAQILFFTGVRYLRMSEEALTPVPQAACGVRQKGGGADEGSLTRRR